MCTEFQHLRGQVLGTKGLAYLLTHFSFLENSKNGSKLKDWINFGIYWKNKKYYRILGLGLGSVALALTLHVSSLALAYCPWPWPWP